MAGVNDINLFEKPDYPGTNDIQLGRAPGPTLVNMAASFTDESVFTGTLSGHTGGGGSGGAVWWLWKRRRYSARRRHR